MLNRYLRERGDKNIKSVADLLANSTFYNHAAIDGVTVAPKTRLEGLSNRTERLTKKSDGSSVVRRVPINNLDGNGWNVSRMTLQLLVNQVMAQHKLDALFYPTKTIPAPRVGMPVEPANIKVVKETITTMIDGEPHERTVDRVIDARAPLTWRFSPNGGFPTIVVPAGFTKEVYDRAVIRGDDGSRRVGDLVGPTAVELPVSVDFLGRAFSEPVLIRIAAAYEQATRHRRPPKAFTQGQRIGRCTMNTAFSAIFALALLLAAGGAQARITEIRIDAVEPFIDGHAFGTVGPYERLKGIAKGELDPAARENAGIVDLDKAPRNSRGMVEYEVDIFILRPADPAKGSGILYYEVLNRGNKQLGTRLLDVTSGGAVSLANALNNPTTPAHVGNAFVFERGYTVVWSAWDPDVSSANARMTARFPVAMENGAPMVRRIREEFQVGKRRPADLEVVRLNYPTASTDRAKAQLFVRDRQTDQRTEVPTDQWEFASADSVRLLPKGTKFTTAAIYELYYEATQSKVVGIGFAATRDVVSFLRHEKADDKGSGQSAQRTRYPPCARVRWLAGRALPAPLRRIGNEQGPARPQGVRRRLFAHRGRRQGLCQPQLCGAGPHRHPARGPRLSRELVPVLDRAHNRYVGRQDRLAAPRRRIRSADDRDQHLDRILAEGCLAAHHGYDGQPRSLTAGELPRLHDRRDAAWRPGRARNGAWRVRQPNQSALAGAGDAGAPGCAGTVGDRRHRAAREPRAEHCHRHCGRRRGGEIPSDQRRDAGSRRQSFRHT